MDRSSGDRIRQIHQAEMLAAKEVKRLVRDNHTTRLKGLNRRIERAYARFSDDYFYLGLTTVCGVVLFALLLMIVMR